MDATLQTILVVFAACAGAFSQSAFGFGSPAISMPIITLVAGLNVATPLVAMVLLVTNVVIVASDWRQIEFRALWRVLLATILSLPLGLLLVFYVPPAVGVKILGGLLVIFGLYFLLPLKLPYLQGTFWDIIWGVFAGVVGAAYNFTGLPVIIYYAMRRWPPVRFRATLSGYFLPSTAAIFISHILAGFWTTQIIRLSWITLPFVLLTIALGSWLNHRLEASRFARILAVLVTAMGVLMLIR